MEFTYPSSKFSVLGVSDVLKTLPKNFEDTPKVLGNQDLYHHLAIPKRQYQVPHFFQAHLNCGLGKSSVSAKNVQDVEN